MLETHTTWIDHYDSVFTAACLNKYSYTLNTAVLNPV